MSSLLSQRIANLNPQQQKAVQTTEGPVMVIAGPGTGKTETLGARIASILEKQNDISPSNILCLTYTTAGVVAMRKRLLQFIGPSAHQVQIHTFHSFCNSVIQENSEVFNIKNAENISELEQHEIAEEIIDGLSEHHALFKKSGYFWVKDLLSLFQTIKSEGWSMEYINQSVQDYIKNLYHDEKYIYKKSGKWGKAGDIKQKEIDEEIEKMQKFVAAVELFEKYQQKMQEKNAYDFQDMIMWVINAWKTNETLLAKYQERFLYILVDEFQDTNGSQKEIVDLLTSYWDEPNIFIVGDDDQSIYRFQGANMHNIVDFWHQHQNAAIISIDKNYRSSTPILALAQQIIEKNTQRLTNVLPHLQKNLSSEAKRFSSEDTPMPKMIHYQSPLHEQKGIIEQLRTLQKQNIDLSEVAVLYQNHAQVENLIQVCIQDNIPFQVKKSQNILELPIIKNLLLMMEYLYAESQKPFSAEHMLFPLLFFPWFTLSAQQIHQLAHKRISSNEKNIKILIERLISTEEFLFLQPIISFFELEKKISELPILEWISHLISKSGMLAYIEKQENKAFLIRAVSSFFTQCKTLVQKNPDTSLNDIFSMIQRLKRHSISMSIQEHTAQKNGVHFTTAHSSKGLEFEHVFLMGIEKNVWDKSKKSGNFSFPSTLIIKNNGDDLEEKRRLFFVAITRAKKYLTLSHSIHDENGKEKDHSLFIAECAGKVEEKNICFSEEEIMEFQWKLMHTKENTEKDNGLSDSDLAILLDQYTMSPTHLNKFLSCPKSFYYETLLRVPCAKNAHATYGSAMHFALDSFFSKYKGIATKDDIKKEFIEYMQKNRFAFIPEEYNRFTRHGEKILDEYFEKNLNSPRENLPMTEKKIVATINGISISGNIDYIEKKLGQEIEIIDYKTGNPNNPETKKKLEKPSEKNNFLGGDYWRQIVFYALLAENKPYEKWHMQRGIFDFIEHDTKIAFAVSEEEKDIVKNQISLAYTQIQQGNFTGCQKAECIWCNL